MLILRRTMLDLVMAPLSERGRLARNAPQARREMLQFLSRFALTAGVTPALQKAAGI